MSPVPLRVAQLLDADRTAHDAPEPAAEPPAPVVLTDEQLAAVDDMAFGSVA